MNHLKINGTISAPNYTSEQLYDLFMLFVESLHEFSMFTGGTINNLNEESETII